MERRARAFGVAGLAGLANVAVAALPGLWMPALAALDPGTAGTAFGLLATANVVLQYASLTLVAGVAGFRLASRADRAPGPVAAVVAFGVAGLASSLASQWVAAAVSTVRPGSVVDPSWTAASALLFALSGLAGTLLARWSDGGGGGPTVAVRSG